MGIRSVYTPPVYHTTKDQVCAGSMGQNGRGPEPRTNLWYFPPFHIYYYKNDKHLYNSLAAGYEQNTKMKKKKNIKNTTGNENERIILWDIRISKNYNIRIAGATEYLLSYLLTFQISILILEKCILRISISNCGMNRKNTRYSPRQTTNQYPIEFTLSDRSNINIRLFRWTEQVRHGKGNSLHLSSLWYGLIEGEREIERRRRGRTLYYPERYSGHTSMLTEPELTAHIHLCNKYISTRGVCENGKCLAVR